MEILQRILNELQSRQTRAEDGKNKAQEDNDQESWLQWCQEESTCRSLIHFIKSMKSSYIKLEGKCFGDSIIETDKGTLSWPNDNRPFDNGDQVEIFITRK